MSGWRTLLPNAAYIARREYLVRVRGRSFVLSTVSVALLALALAFAPVVIQLLSQGARTHVAVYARGAGVPADTMAVLDRSLFGASSVGDSPGTRRQFELSTATDTAAAEADVRSGRLDALLVICRAGADGAVPAACRGGDAVGGTGAEAATPGDLVFAYRADTTSNGRQVYFVLQAARALASEDRVARLHIDPAALVQLQAPVAFSFLNPKADAGGQGAAGSQPPRSDEEEVGRILGTTVLVVLIFVVVITYGTWVAMSVAEEKSSRVMELMLTAATPLQMLTGKVVGTGLAGFTQYLAILLAGGVGLVLQGRVAHLVLGEGSASSLPVAGLTLGILIAFGGFFVLGFALYALLYAAAGSMVSRQEDVQQASMPLMMVSMVGYFAATFAIQGIAAPWVAPLSFVPFFAPYLMLARLMLGSVAPWEVAVCLAILVVTIVAALWLAARIYSAGVLLYGQRVGLRRILAAARTAR
ncbi:MAG TPA: ABC transporter permease [Candidatus Limnocylindrales bacterium]